MPSVPKMSAILLVTKTKSTSDASASAKPVAKAAAKPAASQPPAASAQPRSNEHLNDQGKLTDAERQHRIDTGACLYCGVLGHFAKECNKKQGGRVKAAAATSSNVAPAASVAPAPTVPTARASYTVQPSESDDSGNE